MPRRRDSHEFDDRYLRHHERRLHELGYRVVAGIDEAGRGALAGPVVAAAVVLPPEVLILGVQDSKALTAEVRARLCREIWAAAEAVGVGIADAAEIDAVNILEATYRAMARAVAALDPPADFALVDGLPVKRLGVPHQGIVKGDQEVFLIAAASIVAKVTRDALMVELEAQYPGYGFAAHKGYGTRSHREAIRRLGVCPIHRRSFGPVAEALHPSLPALLDGRE
jgi:ribonuclease HII